MDYPQLGSSGLRVPVLSFGTGTFGGIGPLFSAWGQSDETEARRLVDVCLDAGVTLFDTADVYSNGASEAVLGAAIKGRRDKVLISTKTGLPMGWAAGLGCVARAADPRGRGFAAAARHRPCRPAPASCLRRLHAR